MLGWQHDPVARKGVSTTRGSIMSAVYPRLYPALFFGLLAYKGYLLMML
ncbi:MAG: hypothetical protein V2I66_08845 [Halieaceae bacterium]|nr:hypothetical protein [Halieaceae bacterium]